MTPGPTRNPAGPTIGAVVSAYDAERWIAETLEHILGQTAPPDEVIVVDNGSSDATGEVARGFGEQVRVVRQDPNRGPAGGYNRAVAESASDYVAFCPADDLWDPRKLELQRAALAEHPDVDIAFGGARYFGLEERDFHGPAAAGRLNSGELLPELYAKNVVPAPTTVVRRELFDRLGGFREDLAAEDYEFWLRALLAGAVLFNDPRVLVRLRQHGGNLSSQALAMWEMNHQIHSLYAEHVDDDLARRTLANDLRTIGRASLGLGRVDDARRAYRASTAHVAQPGALAWRAALAVPGAGGLMRRVAARRRGDPAPAR